MGRLNIAQANEKLKELQGHIAHAGFILLLLSSPDAEKQGKIDRALRLNIELSELVDEISLES